MRGAAAELIHEREGMIAHAPPIECRPSDEHHNYAETKALPGETHGESRNHKDEGENGQPVANADIEATSHCRGAIYEAEREQGRKRVDAGEGTRPVVFPNEPGGEASN